MTTTCKAKHPLKSDVYCVFGYGHEVSYHFGGSDDSNGNIGYRWPVQGSQTPPQPTVGREPGIWHIHSDGSEERVGPLPENVSK